MAGCSARGRWGGEAGGPVKAATKSLTRPRPRAGWTENEVVKYPDPTDSVDPEHAHTYARAHACERARIVYLYTYAAGTEFRGGN